MANDPLRSDPVFGKLRRMTALHYVMLDGEKKVQVPKAGNRWRKLADIMDGIEWDTCEAFDEDGTLLGVCRNENVGDDDDDDASGPADAPVTVGELAHVMKDLVVSTMKETREMFQAQIEGNARIIEGMADANRTIADSYSQALQVSSAVAAAQAGSEGGPEVMEMLKLAMPLVMMSRQTTQPAPVQRAIPRQRQPFVRPAKPAAPPVDASAEVKP